MAIAIITGASSGIGSEFVRQMKGYTDIDQFWLIARRESRMEKLAEELGINAKVIGADLCTDEGVEKIRALLHEQKPEISYLINAAGFGNFGAFDELDEGEAGRLIDLNVKALVLITHMCIPYMIRGGRIIELGSGSCFTPLPNLNVYAASKSFVLHYSKGLKYEVKKYGVSVTCFCPGWVDTEFIDKATADTTVSRPKKLTPMLSCEKVVRGCLKAVKKRKTMYVTGKYTKLQHVLFKLLPDSILTKLWLGMQIQGTKGD